MQKLKRIYCILILISFVINTTVTYGGSIEDDISKVREDINELAMDCDFDAIHTIKKRFIYNLSYEDISDETLIEIANFLDFHNDYILNALIDIERGFKLLTSDTVNGYMENGNPLNYCDFHIYSG